MTEANNEQQPLLEYQQLLENVEKRSEQNFSKVKDRLFNFYYDGIRETLIQNGELSQKSTRHDVRKLFEPNPGDLKVENLRIVKALRPDVYKKSEHIPEWAPDEIKNKLENGLRVQHKSELFFGYTVSLGLIQLFRPEGLLSSTNPEVNLSIMGGEGRLQYEKVLQEIGDEEVHPHYAIVEKQENDLAYAQQVSNYGTSFERPDMGIQMVLSMDGRIGERAIYTIGDSTICLTNPEITQIDKLAKKDPWPLLETMLLRGDTSKKSELEREISDRLFPNHSYQIEAIPFGMGWMPFIITSGQIIRENLLGKTVLLPAFELSRKLKSWELLDPKDDYLEAQILDPVKPNNCERILIDYSVRPHLLRVLELMPEFKSTYDKLMNQGIIKYHQTYFK